MEHCHLLQEAVVPLVTFAYPSIYTHLAFSFLAGLLAPQVSLSQVCRAAQVKFDEGLQHNTYRAYHGEQHMFWSFCAQYHLTAFPASEDMLMVFATYLGNHLQSCYATMHHYMVAIHAAHIPLGLPNPLQNCPHLQQLLQAIHHWQSQPLPDSGQQGITTEFLHQARPLHQLLIPKDSVLWAALTLSHYDLFCSGKLAQPKLAKARVPQFIWVWNVTLHFLQGHLHYVHIMLLGSRMDPFQLGCPVIIGCTGTPVCGACKAWHIIQDHKWTQTPLDASYLQIDSRALDHLTLVRHIKAIMAKLGLNPSRYSGHILCIRGATSAVQAGLSQWQIKLLGQWNSQAYQLYICQDPLMCMGFAACMAANLWSYFIHLTSRQPDQWVQFSW